MAKTRISKTVAVVADRKAAAPVSPAVGTKAVKGIATAAKAYRKAGGTLLNSVSLHVLSLGCALTSEQWDRQFKDALIEAFKAEGFASPDQMASKYKMVAIALASGLPAFKLSAFPMGMTFKDYLEAVREPLRSAVLKDGRTVFPVKADGTAAKTQGRKPMTAKAKADAAKARAVAKAAEAAKGSAGVSRDAEGGRDVSRYAAIATSLMGSEKAGNDLLTILSKHRKAYDAWAAKTLASTAPAPAAKPPAEPTKEDKALNRQILDMANGTEGRKANGAVN